MGGGVTRYLLNGANGATDGGGLGGGVYQEGEV